MKHLLTFLRHGVSGTLASTVGSPSFDRRGTMLKHYAFMLLFLLASLNVWGYTITFSTGSGDGTSASTSTACSTIVSDGASYLSGNLVTATKVYYSGSYGLKLGASSNAGTIKMNLASSVTPTSIVVSAKLYNSSKAATLKVNGSATQNITTDFSNLTFNITSSTSYIQLESSKYCWIESITVNTGSSQPTVSVEPSSLDFETVHASAEASKVFSVSGSNLTAGNLTLTVPDGFSVDPSSIAVDGTLAATNVTVSKNTSTENVYAGNLLITGGGLESAKTVALTMTVDADPAPTGTFELFSGDLVEGDYVIYYDGKAMKNNIASDRLSYVELTPVADAIADPDVSIIWHIAQSGDYWTIYNEEAKAYAASTGANNKIQMLEDGTSDNAKWAVSGSATYEFVNQNTTQTNKNLRNNGTYGFACYANSTGGALTLYKKHVDVAVEKPTISGETSFLTSTTVTLDCSTDGATIYYTTDESDPKTSETKQIYSDAFNLTETTKVRAIANKGDDWSEEATSKTFTKITPDYTTIAAFLSEKPNADKYIQFAGNVVVTGVNGKNVFIQDESGNAICLYFAANSTWTKGHKVTGMFQAKYATYGNMPEMSIADGNEGTIAATETAALPDPIEITSLEEATINANMCKYVVLKSVYFQGQSLMNQVVNLQDASSNVLKFYDNLSLTDGKALPLTATACDVTGVLISYHQKNPSANINEILPVDGTCINAGAAALPTLSTEGSTDEEHPTMVANGESITITPAAGFTSTLNGESLNAATNISITETESNTVIAVSASRDYYATANATYYFKANPAGTKYAITVVQPAQGGSLEANFAETEAGNIVTLTATPTNSHFTFDGWVVKKTGEPEASPETVTENQFSMPEYDVTVTGSFTEEAKATLTFAKGEADGEEAAPGNIVDYIGETVQLPANPFTYKGHKFVGWSCDGGTTKLAAGANYVLAEDKAFVAQWDEIPTFDDPNYEWQLVTSDAQLVAGKYYVIGSASEGKTANKTITSGYLGNVASTIADGAIAYDALGENTAIFELGGESGAWTLVEAIEEKQLTGATTANLVWDGATNTTWPISIDGENAIIGASDGYRVLYNVNSPRFKPYNSATNASMLLPQLYVWAEKVYKLLYDANGGKNAPAAQAAVAGEATVTDAKPTYTDHIFNGWNTLIGGDGEAKAAGDVIDLSAGDVTLYAQWRTPEIVTVSYDANGGEGTMDADENQTEGSTYTIKTNTFERNGYLFVGWKAYDANDVELTITNGKFIVPATNVTVKAQWGAWTATDFVLVTDKALLKDGDKVYIVAAEYERAMGTQNTNYRNEVAIQKAGSSIKVMEGAEPVELTLGKDGDNFTFNDGTGYLYAAGTKTSKENYMNTKVDADAACNWTITIDENGTKITSVVNDKTPFMQYNPGSTRFSCYNTASQQAVVLYKKENAEPVYETVRSGLEVNRYYTVCLPKKVTAIKGASFWTLNSKSQDGAIAYLEEETNNLPFVAGKPFIIQATAAQLEVVYEGAATEDAGTNGALHGTLVYMNAAALAAAGSDVYMLFNNELRPVGVNNHLDANRAYVKLSELDPVAEAPQSAPGRRVRAMPMQPQVATGFEAAEANEAPRKMIIDGKMYIFRGEKMYNANGQLVK